MKQYKIPQAKPTQSYQDFEFQSKNCGMQKLTLKLITTSSVSKKSTGSCEMQVRWKHRRKNARTGLVHEIQINFEKLVRSSSILAR